MLFKDQCVHRTNISAKVETDTTITSIGYRVKVGSDFVTEMRVFNNVGDITANIDIQNLIGSQPELFFPYLANTNVAVHTVSSSKRTAQVVVYELVYTKETGVTTTSTLGTVTMSNIIDGKFGNYFPTQMLNQSTEKFVLLTNKYSYGGKIMITKNSRDVFTFFALANCTVGIYTTSNVLIGSTTSCAANGMYVVSLNSYVWGQTLQNYKIILDASGTGGDALFEFEVMISPYLEGLPYRRGTQKVEEGELRFNMFVKHPYGGLDSLGTVNMQSMSGSSNRQSVRVQDTRYVRGGSANDFETTTQVQSKFSTTVLPVISEGTFSYTYESYITNVNELWIAAMAASKSGYLVGSSLEFSSIIEVEINSVSASIETVENEEKIWKVSVSCTQKVPFVA
jgi:hypothetical protein